MSEQSVTKSINELTRIQDEQSHLKSIKATVTETKVLTQSEAEELVGLIDKEWDNLSTHEKYIKSKIKEEIDKLSKK